MRSMPGFPRRAARSAAVLLGCALAGTAGAADAACGASGDAPFATFRSQPPLLLADPDSALVVAWHADGCVEVTFPRQDRDRGLRRLQMDTADHASARATLDALGLARFDPQALASRLAHAKASRPHSIPDVRVSDENIVELTLAAPGAAPQSIRYASLRQDVLRFPGDPDLDALLAAESLFLELAGEARRHGREPPR